MHAFRGEHRHARRVGPRASSPTTRSNRRGLTCTVALFVALASPPARASLSLDDQAKLARGERVEQHMEVRRGDRRYVGGIAYHLVDAPIGRVERLIRDPLAYAKILPHVKSVSLVGIDAAGRATLAITHQFAWFTGGYRMRVEFSEHGRLGRFFLLPSPESAVRDGWGYLRLTPIGERRTLVTYGLLYDLGNPLLSVFEDRLATVTLTVPSRIALLVSP